MPALVSIEGKMGGGKSSTAVFLAKLNKEKYGRKIISNIHLKDIEYTHLTLDYIIEHIVETQDLAISNSSVVLDEAQQFIDGRSAGSKLNKVMSYFSVQARKRDSTLYLCTHQLENIDVRLRTNVDTRMTCRTTKKRCKRCRGTGSLNGIVCPDCLGFYQSRKLLRLGEIPYTVVGVTSVDAFSREEGYPYNFWFIGNYVWGHFATEELQPLLKQSLEGIKTEVTR